MSEDDARNKVVERALAALVSCGLAVKVGPGYRTHAAHYELVIPGEERGTPQSPNGGKRGTPQSRKGGLHSPPTCTQTYGGAAPDAPRPRHPFRDDGSGQSCAACGLPAGNGIHDTGEQVPS